MLKRNFSITFYFPLDTLSISVPLTADVAWKPDTTTYFVHNIRTIYKTDNPVLPAMEIRQRDHIWIHDDSESSTLLSEVAGAAILRYELEGPGHPQQIHQQLSGFLEGAIKKGHADFGNIQLLDKNSGTLQIVCQKGFRHDFLKYFETVTVRDSSACGNAMKNLRPVVIPDVLCDNSFAPHREIAVASGFRAVMSVPLLGVDKSLIGVISIHSSRVRSDWADSQAVTIAGGLGSFMQAWERFGK